MTEKKTVKAHDPRPYWMQRRDMKNKAAHGKEEKAAEKKEEKSKLGKFFQAAASEAGSTCENCGKGLASTIKFHPRAHVCHIVPKTKIGGCPSVATHKQNRWFGCLDCHTFYDEKVAKAEFYEVVQMKVMPAIRTRFALFEALIVQAERKNIPEFLLTAKGTAVNPIQKNDKRGKTKGRGK